jgi:predicted GIY-YIG superfamily endonuclease
MVRFKLYPNRSYEVIQGFLDELQTSGCYKITFEDGFYYIGMSNNIASRMERHLINMEYDLNEVSDRMIRVVLSKDKPVKAFRRFIRMELAYRMSETVLFEKIDDNVFNEKHHIHQNSGVMCLNVIDNIFWKGRPMKECTISKLDL